MKTLFAVICVLPALLIPAQSALAQDCINPETYTRWVTSCPFAGAARSVAVVGDFAYVAADYEGGMRVVDITDPEHPVARGQVAMPGSGYNFWIDAQGSYAYLACYDQGLQVVDVSDPDDPHIAGSVPIAGDMYGVAVSGTHAYLADDDGYLRVVDVSTPTAPSLVASLPLPGWPESVDISGNHAFVVESDSLMVVDITTPASPAVVAGIDLPGDDVARVNIYGTEACIALQDEGFCIVDIADPLNPVMLGSAPADYQIYEAALVGDRVYAAEDDGYVLVFDVADRADPVRIGPMDVNGYPQSFAMHGGYMLAANDDWGLGVIELGDPLPLDPLDTDDLSGYGYGVAISGDYACVVEEMYLHVFTLDDPEDPGYRNLTTGLTMAYDIAAEDDVLFVPRYPTGVDMFQLSSGGVPALLGNLAGDAGYGGCVDAGIGLMAYSSSEFNIHVYFVTNPAMPEDACTISTGTSWCSDLLFGEGCLYAALGSGHLATYDLSDPYNPGPGTFMTELRPKYLAMQGNLLFASSEITNEIFVFDILNAASPVLMTRFPTASRVRGGMLVSGGVLYAGGYHGLHVYDVSDPYSVDHLGCVKSIDSVGGLADRGNIVYYTDSDSKLHTTRRHCADPLPALLPDLRVTPGVARVSFAWTFAGDAAADDFRLDARRADETWTVPVVAAAGGFAAEDRNPALAAGGAIDYELNLRGEDGQWRLLAGRRIELEVPAFAARIVDVHPNPFNPRTEVTVGFGEPSRARVAIHDLQGRLVAVLADGDFSPGEYILDWNGRDTGGAPAAAGAYLLRLETAGRIDARKIMLVR